ncbi:MAG TPA: CPBP family intramembrane glutamic endopeptidase [Polyangia bacterium]
MADQRRRTLIEVVLVFALATGAASALYNVGQSVGFIHRNLHPMVALVFLLLPQIVLRRRGNIERYGFTAEPLGLGLIIAALAILIVLPLFAVGFVVAVRTACAHAPTWVPGSCFRATHPLWRLPPDFALQAAAQLVVIALPEELFFRGYVQGRLEDALPPTRTLWGARVGWAWILGAALFGLGHFLVTFEPQMLSRFFPGLAFGWMFARTRSILASTIFHAACNLIMAVLGSSLLS